MLAIWTLARPAGALDLAGNVEHLEGSAHATSAAGLSRPLRNGSTILVGDRVSTATGAHLLLRMNDGAKLALGSNTSISVDVYEEDEDAGRALLGLEQGVFFVKAGEIARSGPDCFTLSTPVGVLGLRATEIWAEQFPDHLALVLLSGEPLTVTTPQGSVELTQAETGVDLVVGQPPPPPTQWDSERLEIARRAVAFP
jgi:hypothetical protein